MIKKFLFVLAAFGCILFAGCSQTNARSFDGQNTVENVIQSEIAQAQSGSDNAAQGSADSSAEDESISVSDSRANGSEDIDLTVMSSTMVYSQVYDMMSKPEDYIGKTVRMSGAFSEYYDETNDKTYYACIIKDATACCSQGIEFILSDESYEYPEDGSEICVVGTFDVYEEGQFRYSTLRDAEIV